MNHWRRIRQQKQVKLTEMEKKTRIPFRYLEAIDQGEFSKIPAGIIGANYIRTYAKCIGIDSATMVRLFETSTQTKHIEYQQTQPRFSRFDEIEEKEEVYHHNPRQSDRLDLVDLTGPQIPARRSSRQRFQTTSMHVSRRIKHIKGVEVKKIPWYGWMGIAIIVLAIPIGFYVFGDDSSSHATNSPAGVETITSNPNRPKMELQPSSEGQNSSDVYHLSNIDKVELTIAAKGATTLKVYQGSSAGPLIKEVKLTADKVEKFEDAKGLYIRIGRPDQVQLKVNQIEIDTSDVKNVQAYQFSLVE